MIMKARLMSFVMSVLVLVEFAGGLAAQGTGRPDSYVFDRYNQMKVEFFARGGELMRTLTYNTWYREDGKEAITTSEGLNLPAGDFAVEMDAPSKGNDLVTLFDMKNGTAVQIFGSDLPEPMYNSGGWKYPAGAEIKKLDLVATGETRLIAGYTCRKFTYAFKKITGSVWMTDEVKLPNDLGIFRAAKMVALHNTLSDSGFVMEMTSEDDRGGKTVMTTVSIGNTGTKTITLPTGKVGKAINKVSYFSF
jgi:hypothetical protein